MQIQPTPHSGFHWNLGRNPYFEGWYYRLTIPPSNGRSGASFAFMYSIQDPGTSRQSCVVQVLGPGDDYCWSRLPSSSTNQEFLACPSSQRHSFRSGSVTPTDSALKGQGYTVTPYEHYGQVFDCSRRAWLSWHFLVEAIHGWGKPGRRQQSTAGWMSRFQLFEPGWQVLLAHGRARGWITWTEDRQQQPEAEKANSASARQSELRTHFQQIPFYAEKNWGASFPRRWFWIQCNCFLDHPSLTLTSAGGIRRLLGWEETLGMIGIHHHDSFYEFVPWNSRVSWRIAPWGSWQIWAQSTGHAVELTGRTSAPGIRVRVPTVKGLELLCRDTTEGELSLALWRIEAGRKLPILRAHSSQAGLEIGGEGWDRVWACPTGP